MASISELTIIHLEVFACYCFVKRVDVFLFLKFNETVSEITVLAILALTHFHEFFAKLRFDFKPVIRLRLGPNFFYKFRRTFLGFSFFTFVIFFVPFRLIFVYIIIIFIFK